MKSGDVDRNSETRTVEGVELENWKTLGEFYDDIADEVYQGPAQER
ncbi:MAG: hypothetical protein ABEJ07_03020 [Candidatus Nanohaloarchaea archaeon]